MSIPVKYTSSSGNVVNISNNGELYVASKYFDTSSNATLSAGVPANIAPPVPGKIIVLTAFSVRCTINTGAVVFTIYAEDSADGVGSLVTGLAHEEAMEKGDKTTISGLNLAIEEGKYLNVHADAGTNATFPTLFWHYEDV